MSKYGSRNCTDFAARRTVPTSTRRIGLCLSLVGVLLLSACASVPPAPKSPAQKDLQTQVVVLGAPLEGTVAEGTAAGGIMGTGLSIGLGGDDAMQIAIPLGLLAGNLAGQYVAAKQSEYGAEVEVVEAITEDVRRKNQDAERTVASMEVVVAEDRARLAELREAQSQGADNEVALKQQVALAEDDLATMQQAVEAAEAHVATFANARAIVLNQSESPEFRDTPEVTDMDSEIEILRDRIRAMKGFVDELASVG
jgi:ribosome-associated translation inhibitor RaiA